MDDIAGNEQNDKIEVDGAGIADLCTSNQQDENEPIMKIPNEVSVLITKNPLSVHYKLSTLAVINRFPFAGMGANFVAANSKGVSTSPDYLEKMA